MNFDQLPTTAPQTPVLDRIDAVREEISALSSDELVTLANELREFVKMNFDPIHKQVLDRIDAVREEISALNSFA